MLNKKVLLSVLIIGVVATVAGAGTWAQFTDTKSSTGNTFTAGDLYLTIGGTGLFSSVSAENVKPGDSDELATNSITVINSGSMKGNLKATVKNVGGAENGFVGGESAVDSNDISELPANLYVKIYQDNHLVKEGILSGIVDQQFSCAPLAKDGGSSTFTVTYSVDSNVGNEIQSDSATFDIEFYLEQAIPE